MNYLTLTALVSVLTYFAVGPVYAEDVNANNSGGASSTANSDAKGRVGGSFSMQFVGNASSEGNMNMDAEGSNQTMVNADDK